jgi:hypothetical protein
MGGSFMLYGNDEFMRQILLDVNPEQHDAVLNPLLWSDDLTKEDSDRFDCFLALYFLKNSLSAMINTSEALRFNVVSSEVEHHTSMLEAQPEPPDFQYEAFLQFKSLPKNCYGLILFACGEGEMMQFLRRIAQEPITLYGTFTPGGSTMQDWSAILAGLGHDLDVLTMPEYEERVCADCGLDEPRKFVLSSEEVGDALRFGSALVTDEEHVDGEALQTIGEDTVCIDCAELRLGRHFQDSDFRPISLNDWVYQAMRMREILGNPELKSSPLSLISRSIPRSL